MIKEILEKIAQELSTNVSILAYCTTKYSKNPTVFLGQNVGNPVDKRFAPAIIIAGVESKRANDEEYEFRILIGVLIENETISTVSNLKTFSGFVECEELTEKIEIALLKLRYKSRVEYTGISCENFPMFSAKLNFIIDKMNPLRGN